MADPSYIDASGVLTDPEAWVALKTDSPSSANIVWNSPNDGSSLDWGQFMDLAIIGYARSATSGSGVTGVYLRINNDGGNDYGWQQLQSDGSSASADGNASLSYIRFGVAPQASATTNAFGAYIMYFADINSGKYKSVLCQGAADKDGSGNVNMFAGVYRSPSPIIRIDLLDDTGFAAGSRFDLFGVLPRMVS